ncbi:hypothetical protein CRG98_042513 [Punica granatum]|uniref:Uncharacterized protein n=1 Tax=Punica granatum TaxID=22663 RepID=A0A2I0HZE4_PUNGR|nr:hypothetical protein CRG98_042513 [Punica granatum]
MEPELQASIAGAKDAKLLWDDLRERFSQGNDARVYQIKSGISLLKQEGQVVSDYYSKLKALWDELENYLGPPMCTCAAAVENASQRQKEKAYQFLIRLGSEFKTVRSTILSKKPMPSFNKAANLGRSVNWQQLGGGSRPSCDFCGKLGHWKSTCWNPQAAQQPRSGSIQLASKREMEEGAIFGPKWKQRRKGSTDQVRPALTGTPLQRAHVANQHATQPPHSGQSGRTLQLLSEAQFHRLLSIVGPDQVDLEPNTGNNFVFINSGHDWINDSGSSRNMSGRADYFTSLSPITGKSPIYIMKWQN